MFFKDGLFEGCEEDSLTHTWAPSANFRGTNVEYAQIWCHGKSLEQASPEHLKKRFRTLNERARVFLKTFYNAHVNLDDVCFYDLVPEKFLIDFYGLKNEITKHVFANFEKPKNYDFLLELTTFLKTIENRTLNIDFGALPVSEPGTQKISYGQNKVIYNPWRTVTGRLTTEKDSFPILTLNKNLRGCIKPKNDILLELDYNSAELRVLLGLLGQEQPEEDLHSWIVKNVFDDKIDREASKKKTFAWLYNPNSKNKKLNQFLDRDKLVEKYFTGKEVVTPFGRTVATGREKAVNYLVQSTSSDMLLKSAMSVNKLLKNKKSFVSFCIHDSIIVDMVKEDRPLIEQLQQTFSKTMFGTLKTNVSLGKDFGSMRKIS
tara:strand:- start:758 stop:1882 length:1125 start_codon:yes stop_codon:yes gene_type:complete